MLKRKTYGQTHKKSEFFLNKPDASLSRTTGQEAVSAAALPTAEMRDDELSWRQRVQEGVLLSPDNSKWANLRILLVLVHKPQVILSILKI